MASCKNDFLCTLGLCILCLKRRTFLCEGSVLCHNKRNCFPSYRNQYLSPTSMKNEELQVVRSQNFPWLFSSPLQSYKKEPIGNVRTLQGIKQPHSLRTDFHFLHGSLILFTCRQGFSQVGIYLGTKWISSF